jgi:hypothetical protein
MVEQADVFVADATYPSTGLGIELQIAEGRDIPVILSFHQAPETRMAPVEYVNLDSIAPLATDRGRFRVAHGSRHSFTVPGNCVPRSW